MRLMARRANILVGLCGGLGRTEALFWGSVRGSVVSGRVGGGNVVRLRGPRGVVWCGGDGHQSADLSLETLPSFISWLIGQDGGGAAPPLGGAGGTRAHPYPHERQTTSRRAGGGGGARVGVGVGHQKERVGSKRDLFCLPLHASSRRPPWASMISQWGPHRFMPSPPHHAGRRVQGRRGGGVNAPPKGPAKRHKGQAKQMAVGAHVCPERVWARGKKEREEQSCRRRGRGDVPHTHARALGRQSLARTQEGTRAPQAHHQPRARPKAWHACPAPKPRPPPLYPPTNPPTRPSTLQPQAATPPHTTKNQMAPAKAASDAPAAGFFDALPPSVRTFVMGAVALHVLAFGIWALLFIKEQRQGKVKSKEF